MDTFCLGGWDFSQVTSASASRVRTLSLVEMPPTKDREPASPFRHFASYLFVERGGFISNLPMTTGYTGALTPVRLAQDAPPAPTAVPLGWSRSFVWQDDANGWDQFIIRDLDPEHPFDYFREHADEVELLARSGRWRLYTRRR